MEADTLEALKGSIAKWEERAAGNYIAATPRNCPLCKLFFDRSCRGCPVSEKTGRDSCEATPYEGYTIARNEEEGVIAAKEEVEFLKSLLPASSDGDVEHGN